MMVEFEVPEIIISFVVYYEQSVVYRNVKLTYLNVCLYIAF